MVILKGPRKVVPVTVKVTPELKQKIEDKKDRIDFPETTRKFWEKIVEEEDEPTPPEAA